MSRRPYVFAGTPYVPRQAARFAPGVVLETACEQAILRGEIEPDPEAGPLAYRVVGDGWVARLHYRRRSPLETREAWSLYKVERRVRAAGAAGAASGFDVEARIAELLERTR